MQFFTPRIAAEPLYAPINAAYRAAASEQVAVLLEVARLSRTHYHARAATNGCQVCVGTSILCGVRLPQPRLAGAGGSGSTSHTTQ